MIMDLRISGSEEEIEEMFRALQSRGFSFGSRTKMYPKGNSAQRYYYLNNVVIEELPEPEEKKQP